MKDILKREKHYQNTARYYKNLAILKRLKSAVHLENKEDERFWGEMFRYYFPQERFYFISYSKNPHGNYTAGSTQCLAYRKYLNKRFIICIDSDYRYLKGEPGINIESFIFQTYTYSFENHLCYSRGLDQVCEAMCGIKNTLYDFNRFLSDYSAIIYDLFLWHFALCLKSPKLFSIKVFWNALYVPHKDTSHQSEEFLSEVKAKAEQKIEEMKRCYPETDILATEEHLKTCGITRENLYLYVRGHNLHTLCSHTLSNVCKRLKNKEREKLNERNVNHIIALYKKRMSFNHAIKQNIHPGAYPEIEKIGKDMEHYADYFTN